MVETNRAQGCSSHPSATDKSGDPLSTITSATWLEGGLAVLNKEGTLVSVNDSLAMWFHATPGELCGQSLAKLLGQRHPGWETAVYDLVAQPHAFDRLEL